MSVFKRLLALVGLLLGSGLLAASSSENGHVISSPVGTIMLGSPAEPTTRLLVSVATGTVRRIKLGAKLGVGAEASLSPSGDKIVVVDLYSMWVARRNGVPLSRLSVTPSTADQALSPAAWSPDSSRLAYTDGSGLWVVADRAGGGKPKRILRGSLLYYVNWSRSDNRIYFTRDSSPTSTGSVESVKPDGSGRRFETRGDDPALSPDGRRLALTRSDDLFIARRPREGKALLFLRHARSPEWSPDGKYLAFVREVDCGESGCSHRVFMIKTDGARERPVGPRDFDVGDFSWGG